MTVRANMPVLDLSTLHGSLVWLSTRGYLSGSRARGDYSDSSDIDVLLTDGKIQELKHELTAQNVPWQSPICGAITWYPQGWQVETAFIFPRYRKGDVVIEGVRFRT